MKVSCRLESQRQWKETSPFWKGTLTWRPIAGPASRLQLCWLSGAATLLSKCDGHSELGGSDVIPADKDTNRLYPSFAIRRRIEQRSKWPECSKLTANGKRSECDTLQYSLLACSCKL